MDCADLKRYQELRAKNFVSQAVLDEKESTFKSAQSNVDASQAAYRGQSNQAGYAALVSDVDGVVTLVSAEAGQVVQPGAEVVRVAKAGERKSSSACRRIRSIRCARSPTCMCGCGPIRPSR